MTTSKTNTKRKGVAAKPGASAPRGGAAKSPKAELLIKETRRNTRALFTSEQKVIIIMEGIRGEVSVAELCRKYGLSQPTYCKSKSSLKPARSVCREMKLGKLHRAKRSNLP